MAEVAALWGAMEIVRLTKETVIGEYDAEANAIWIRLDQDSALGGNIREPQPEFYQVTSADARAELAQIGTERTLIDGTLNTILYPTQAGFLFGISTDLVPTGDPPTYDIPSFTLDHYNGEGWRRFVGCRVAGLDLSCEAANPILRASLGIQPLALEDAAPTVATPAFAAFPQELPYTLQRAAGALKIGADVARTGYEGFTASFRNNLDVRYCESVYPSVVRYCGRAVSYGSTMILTANHADRTNFRGAVALAKSEITFTRGANSLKLDFKSKSRITAHQTDAPLARARTKSLTVTGLFDGAANGSFSYTAS